MVAEDDFFSIATSYSLDFQGLWLYGWTTFPFSPVINSLQGGNEVELDISNLRSLSLLFDDGDISPDL